MMVSMFNRNGLMVKPIDVHEKFARIMSAGVDLPDNAFAFEHCPIKGDPLHDVQIQMMEALIRRSNGMLAPLTGRERFCMIATNHCGQSARAVNFGCATPIKEFQDANGNMVKSRLIDKDRGVECFCQGWGVYVFPGLP